MKFKLLFVSSSIALLFASNVDGMRRDRIPLGLSSSQRTVTMQPVESPKLPDRLIQSTVDEHQKTKKEATKGTAKRNPKEVPPVVQKKEEPKSITVPSEDEDITISETSSIVSINSARENIKKISELRRELEAANARIEDLEEQVQAGDVKEKRLTARVKERENELVAVRASLKNAENPKQLNALRRELITKEEELESLQDELEKAELEKREAILKNAELSEQVNELIEAPEEIQARADAETADLRRQLRLVMKRAEKYNKSYNETYNLATLAFVAAAIPDSAKLAEGAADWEILARILNGDILAIKDFIQGFDPELAPDPFADFEMEGENWMQSVFGLSRSLLKNSESLEITDCIAQARRVAYTMHQLHEKEVNRRKQQFIVHKYFPLVRELIALGVASKIKQDSDEKVKEQAGPEKSQEEMFEDFENVVNTSLSELDQKSFVDEEEEEEEEEAVEQKVEEEDSVDKESHPSVHASDEEEEHLTATSDSGEEKKEEEEAPKDEGSDHGSVHSAHE